MGERSWAGFAVCVLLGATAAFALLVFGILGLLVVGFVTWLTSRTRLRSSAWGLLAGVGAISLLVAYVQRRGPGTFCYRTVTTSGCDQYLDPRPWLVAGVVFVLAAIALHIRAIRRTSRPAPIPR